MSRFRKEFEPVAQSWLEPAELAQLVSAGAVPVGGRMQAIACFLSAHDGWADAQEQLGGAFAGLVTRLTTGSER